MKTNHFNKKYYLNSFQMMKMTMRKNF